jgi:hypothetical protein
MGKAMSGEADTRFTFVKTEIGINIVMKNPDTNPNNPIVIEFSWDTLKDFRDYINRILESNNKNQI